MRRLGVIVTLAMTAALVGYAPMAMAAPITVVDENGADDQPGQKDLNSMTVDYTPANGADLVVRWNWDETTLSGANTGDACTLFDTDGDGKANYSLCVGWDTDLVYQYTRLYSCNDSRTDRCAGGTLIKEDANGDGQLDGGATTCSLQVTSDDPFHAGAFDAKATCNIELADISTTYDPVLTNVCSYPSGEPNSDPSDCVVRPTTGFLTIVKDAGTNTTTPFGFGLVPAANDGRTSFGITGSGSVVQIPVNSTKAYALTETNVPAGWSLASASCTVGGQSTGTLAGQTISGIDIRVGQVTVCTFRNTLVPPSIEVTKTANPTSVPETGGPVTYTFAVRNTSTVPVSITSLSDNRFGSLAGDADCQIGTVLQPGASCDFTLVKNLAGDAPATHTNDFTATVRTTTGLTASDDDDAVVTFTDVLPDISVTKTANPTTLPESGGSVTYTFVVQNNSAEPVAISSMTDDKLGTLTGDADCKVGTVLAARASCTFTATATIAGEPGTSHVNVFTATAADDEGHADTATDDATVTFTNVAPTLQVTKTADPASLPETGGSVTFTYVVKNTALESVTVSGIVDDRFGPLAGDSDCAVGTVLAAGASCSFTYTTTLQQNAGTTHRNVFTATARDNDGTSASASDDAVVTFTNVLPTVAVTKTAYPIAVPETGGSVDFTFVVRNTSFEPVTISALSDDKFGTLVGDDDCQIGTILQPGASCSFTLAKTLAGEPGTANAHVNVFSAIVTDDDNTTATDTDDAVVSFTDVKPALSVTKTASPDTLPETGGSVTFTFVVTNDSGEPVTITSLSDDKFGALAGDDDCKVTTLLPAHGTCTFTYTTTLSGPSGSQHVNVFTATARDNEGNAVSDSDDAVVVFADVLPQVTVTKSADPTSVPETGGVVTFTFTVQNTGTVPFTIDQLVDSVFGTLSGDDDCAVGTVLAPSAGCAFSITRVVAGDVGDDHRNVVTVTVPDDDGNTETGTDDAVVEFTDVLPVVSVTKSADPTSVPETGGEVSFTFVVANDGLEPATITALSDSVFGTLTGDEDCMVGTVLAAGTSCSFSITMTIAGDASGDDHRNVVTVTVQDDDGNTETGTDDAVVEFADVLPTVAVVKDVDVAEAPAAGSEVTFTFTVSNTSAEPVRIMALSDSVFGTLTGDEDCMVGTVLAAGATCSFPVVTMLSGPSGSTHHNVFTATVQDNEGNAAGATDDATVVFTEVLGQVYEPPMQPPAPAQPELARTGADLQALALAAIALLGTGFVLMAASRRRREES